jgi:transcriptional regulator with XRE-family HTH domain
MTERAAFAAELRRARESRGLTLDDLADRTKVSATYFAGLERGDVSRWPSGIFRRSFVRAYAAAVGLDAEPVVNRFVRLFPDPVEDPKGAARAEAANRMSEVVAPARPEMPRASAATTPGLRLVLDNSRPVAAPADRRRPPRGLAACADAGIALVPAAVAGAIGGATWFWAVAACVSIVGQGIAGAVVGRTLGAWLTARSAPAVAPALQLAPAERRRTEADIPTHRRRPVRHAQGRLAPLVHRVRH